RQQYKILVVDDQYESRAMLASLLSSLGFDIREAENGQEAVNWTREWRPDLIFMDLVMPVMDGFEAARQIRKIPADAAGQAGKEMFVIAISADMFGEHRKQSLAAGCNDFLGKPVLIEKVLECLQMNLQLTWISEPPAQSITDEKEAISGQADTLLQKPSRQQASELFRPVTQGHINDIFAYADRIEQADAQF
ncbi:MAG: response regulator, partial [Gammaproteobacteria bacterium]|nr:response regulator [Gammaproteobacteria bacterium]